MTRRALAGLSLAVLFLPWLHGCQSQPSTPPAHSTASPATPPGDAAFATIVDEVVDEWLRRNPTQATYLGVHTYDEQLEDLSRAAITPDIAALKTARGRVAATEPATLSIANQLDREQLLRAIDSQILTAEVIRPWASNPDLYSSAITQTAFLMVKRSFAPPDVRLKALVARETLMLRTLDQARANLTNPPEILTRIAIEQVDGNRDFFVNAVPAAFASVKDAALVAQFKLTNQAVVDALAAYKTFLQKELLPKSKGQFAIGREALAKKLAADDMVELPLDQLLAIARADLARNQQAFKETAGKIATAKKLPLSADAAKTATVVATALSADHPAPAALLKTTQDMLDSIRQFIEQKKLLSIPAHQPAHVEETPPFLRATTSASMDIPGPFETKATEAYYNMTLPDPKWPRAEIESFMRQWYYPMISNVSVPETYPGHYVQFLYASQFPSKVRKVYGAPSNAEGWAHYCEQMMLDEGFHADDPSYRLAQLQDALLRDVRFIVGIRLHSEGMTVAEAQKMFETEAYQPPPNALSEAKRGTTDPTYGYYTMGKLMIMKLRDDYKAKRGASFSLQEFHDTFLKLGPLPLPLIRRAMLGEGQAGAGSPFPPAS
jgi:uncharacterized protein (DUF885 family)